MSAHVTMFVISTLTDKLPQTIKTELPRLMNLFLPYSTQSHEDSKSTDPPEFYNLFSDVVVVVVVVVFIYLFILFDKAMRPEMCQSIQKQQHLTFKHLS